MNLALFACLFLLVASVAPVPTTPAPMTPPTRLVVAGVAVKLRAPMQVVESEILAAIADELPRLGANLSLEASTGAIRIETATKEVVELKVGEPVLTRGEVSLRIPAAPVMRNSELLLPVMQVASALGAYARVDGNGTLWLNPSLQAVQVELLGEGARLRIAMSSPARFRVGTLTNPDRVYIDVDHADLRIQPGEIQHRAEMVGIAKVRVSQFSLSPDLCRVVVELSKPLQHEVRSDLDTSELVLHLGLTGQPEAEKTAAPDKPATPDNPTAAPDPALPLLPPFPSGKELAGLRIVVDAGHGGHDQGATGLKGTLEKHINLDIARRLAAQLFAMGANVIMTRTDDYYVTLAGRCKIANASGAHLFVSVHVNAWPSANGRSGTEVFYTHAGSLPLAKAVHDRMIALLGRKDGGVRRRGLYVTNHTTMPSTLTETAYLNHSEEEKLLNNPDFRQRAGDAIALGVFDYAREHLLKRITTPPAAAATATPAASLSQSAREAPWERP